MKISKVLNNNCVVTYDDSDKMIILMGSAIGFHARKGDEINEERIEKVFRLDNDTNSKFEEIIKDMPLQIVLVTDKIITHIKSKIEKKINDSIYVTLTDHIWTSVERIKAGVKFDQMLLINIKDLYQEEYNVALETTKILTDLLGIYFDETEANFIALHIINSELTSEMPKTYKIINTVNLISNYVKTFLNINTETIEFERFLVHCRFLVQKIIAFNTTNDEEIMSTGLIKFGSDEKIIKQCTDGISDIIKKECDHIINENERLFLMIHLLRLKKK